MNLSLSTICTAAFVAFMVGCSETEPTETFVARTTNAGSYITYSEQEICLGDPATICFNNHYNNNCGNIALQMQSPGSATWVQVATGTPVNGELCYTFTPTVAGSYNFRGRWNATGGPSCSSTGANIGFAAGTATFPLVVNAVCCETAFTGEAISCDATREAEFRFSSDVAISYFKMQGGLTNFTGADAVVTVTGGNDITVAQWSPGGSSNRVIRVEGGIDECDEVVVHITWNSTNSGGIITGQWSVKDADGADIAPPVAGLTCN